MRKTTVKVAAIVCIMALGCAMLVACAGGNNQANSEQRANRNYMSQVNQTMEKLNEQLEAFVDAVSRDDIVNMRTQADNAYKVLDELNAIEAPESLADIKEGYVKGTTELRGALDDYISLYTEMKNAGNSMDVATFEQQLTAVQERYDKGVKLLQEADEAAAAKK